MTYLPPQPQEPPQPPPGVARYGTGVPMPQPAPPKKKLPTWAIIFGVVALVCCGGVTILGIIGTLADKPTTVGNNAAADQPAAQTSIAATTAAAPPPTSAPPPPPPAPAGPATSFGPGMYEVGVDIKAGTYTCTATGPLGGYWERAKNASGEFDAIIANEAMGKGEKSIVSVKAKEFFKVTSADCVIR